MRVLAAAVVLLLLLAGCARPAPRAQDDDLEAALGWLLAQRDADGRWEPGLAAHMAEVAWATGKDPQAWPEERPLAGQLALPPEGDALLPQLRGLYAAALAGGAPRDEAVRRVQAAWDGQQFGDPRLLNDDVFALLVLAAGGRAASPAQADALAAAQAADGGWSWSAEGQGEADMAGLALTALAGTAPSSVGRADVAAALHFLDATQALDGGHSLQPGADGGNCDSTVWALRGYALLGADGSDAAWAFQLGLQRPDGSFAYTPGGPANALCTAEAAALLGLRDAGRLADPWD